MKLLSFLIALLLTIATIYFLDTPRATKTTPIPAFGQLFNPNNGFWQNGTATPVANAPKIKSTELSQAVEVIYDDRLVPHIFAQNAADAMFVQGYIIAQHRLWQIDFATRATAGRLSEILGKRTLEFDREKRKKGMTYAAENTLKAWQQQPESWALLEKYVAGINTYICSLSPADYPIEYKILGYEPELWTPFKTALFAKSMAETLASRASDVSATNALELFGKENFDYIYQTYFEEESPIIPASVKWDAIRADLTADSLQQLGSALPKTGRLPFEEVVEHLGSNNWAVNSKKSATGNPILCGDPHLRITLPAVWFENQIHTPDYNVYGVSLPGTPGVTIGFNENIAWSMTNVGHDISDFYKITWQDSTKQAYLLDGEYIPVEKRIEAYKIKGAETVIDTVRYTQWGPIYLETEGKDIALRWTVHDGLNDDMIGVTYAMNKAKNYDEYRTAIRAFNTPAQNFVFASKNDVIGMTVQGAFAIKKEQQGRFILDGSKSKNAWQGFIPKDHVPAVRNPERNFVASANQHSTAPDYPYVYHSEGFEAYRGRYLNRRLAEKNKWSVAEMMQLQTDDYSLKAEEALPLMLAQISVNALKSEREKKILAELKNWDYHFKKDALAPVYFTEWFQQFYNLTWDEVIDNDDYDYLLKPRHWRTAFMLRDSINAPFFDVQNTTDRESGVEVVQRAYDKMVYNIDSLIHDDPDFSWQEYNAVHVSHLARIAPFSRTNIPTNGTRKALNAISGAHGPSWRMVVELGERVTAKVNYPAGQSGDPASPFYDNFIDSYARGEYYDALFWYDKKEAQERVLYRQTFE